MTDSMDTSQEFTAPTTEQSQQSPPIPPIPLIPISPSPIASPSSPNKINIANAFLPKELAEIVAIRQLRERAWYARLMICTTAISSLESTLANLKDEIEVEEVATVARKGKKKARISLSTKTIEAPVRKATQSLTTENNSPTRDYPSIATTDGRLFVRLPQEHEWHKLSPAGIREVIVRKLAISPALFGKIKPVHSGFALSPCRTEARETILNAGNGLFLPGVKLESTTNWTPVINPTVPATIRKGQGEVEVSKSILTDETERVCSIRPTHVKLCGGNKSGAPYRTWMANFTTAPRTSFRVFDESGIVRKFKKQQPLEFCKRCNGHHPTKNSSRAPLCGNCGLTNHVEELFMAATKCRDCGSPHLSDSRRCLARPTRSEASTKKEHQAVLRAKTAENLAASTQIGVLDITSSEELEAENTTNNSQVPLVEREPTHRAGNTLDLAWMNVKEAMAWVTTEECMTSDNLPICGFVPNCREAAAISQWIPPLTPLNTIEETEDFAQNICWDLENALKAVGKRACMKSGRSAPWWTQECKFAHLEYRKAMEDSERTIRATKLRTTVASAKRAHWKREVEEMKSSRDVYKLMR
ncbi:hypothetical protein EPUL_002531 [Erysiphe pulchra]|uniref:Uncharacterized protein n=1 Tax=Erysiphe pulchra TaxID=225359 RepID=A0A2S4PVP7_9PEZI|nr:hypothetical protein EPUL_002531 [Erysiphe pulchra]